MGTVDARPWLEHEWKRFLSRHGIPVPRGVLLPGDGRALAAVEAVKELRAPLAVKALSVSIVHKTDVGAVRLGVASHEALPAVIGEMLEELGQKALLPVDGVLVEEMAEPGLELVLGVIRDRSFGRLLAFGLGGTRVEALGEISFFALPLRPFDVTTVIGVIPWLEPTLRRVGPATVDAVREVIWRFGGPDGIGARQEIERLEINPLIAGRHGVVAVDARGAFR